MTSLTRLALALGALTFATTHADDVTPSADTFIKEDLANENFGGADFIRARADGPDRIAMIRFDNDALGDATGALLSLHVADLESRGEIHVVPVTSPWDEHDVNYATRPSLGSAHTASRFLTTTDRLQRITLDISPLLASWRAAPQQNYGLAIVAGNDIDVRFSSRESERPPRLVFTTSDAIIVSRTDGDYEDPITAAENAHDGDRWCTAEAQHCTMRIAAGLYVLPRTLEIPDRVEIEGAGKTATLLIADQGVATALQWGFRHHQPAMPLRLTGLSVINRQDRSLGDVIGLQTYGGIELTDVAVRAENGLHNRALVAPGAITTTTFLLRNSDFIAAGGQSTVGVDVSESLTFESIVSSRVTASGGAESNIGVLDNSGGGTLLDDTVVIAEGGLRAFGAFWHDEQGSYQVHGGLIGAFADDSTVEVAGIGRGDVTASLGVYGARIVARGPADNTSGITWNGPTDSLHVQDSIIDSSGSAILRGVAADDNYPAFSIIRSHLKGPTVIDMPRFGMQIHIEGSVLDGDRWAVLNPISERTVFTIVDSILHGTADIPSAETHCTDVLNGDYEPLEDDCLTPVGDVGADP